MSEAEGKARGSFEALMYIHVIPASDLILDTPVMAGVDDAS